MLYAAMYIQLSEVMYYALLDPDMDFIFKERGKFNVKASFVTLWRWYIVRNVLSPKI